MRRGIFGWLLVLGLLSNAGPALAASVAAGRFAGSADGSIREETGQDRAGVEIVVEEMW